MVVIERGTSMWDEAVASLSSEDRHRVGEDQVLHAQAFIGRTKAGQAVRLDPFTVFRKPCGALVWARGE